MSQTQKRSKKFKKLRSCIWAVDAFEDTSQKQVEFEKFMKRLITQLDARVEPVYVLNSEGLNFPSETFSPMIKQFQPAAEKSLSQFLKRFKLRQLSSPKVLVQDQPSLTSSVQSLTRYAERSQAEMIFVNTHARHGIPRLILGSFTESLLMSSRTPIMVLGPKIHAYPFGKILFPTDYSGSALKQYRRVLEWASRLDSHVILYHQETQPIQPILQSGVFLLGGGWVPFPEYMSQAEQEKRKIAEKWVKIAKEYGVQVITYFDSSSTQGVAESILQYARRNKIGLIAMVAQSGSLKSTFIGSITRKVVRAAEAGVMVLRA